MIRTLRFLIALLAATVLVPTTAWAQGLYMAADVGYSQSMAENSAVNDILKHPVPSFAVMLGYEFTPVYGVRINAGRLSHVSRCSYATTSLLPSIYSDGRYAFHATSLTLTGTMNATNIFSATTVRKPIEFSLIAGGGMIKTGGFDGKQIGEWNKYPYYPIDTMPNTYATAHVGIQCAFRPQKQPFDFTLELRGNATDNAYNGVDNGNCLDFYIDFMVGIRYMFNQQTRMRVSPKKEVPYIDPLLRDDGRRTETLRHGEEMHTVVPFYAQFHYLNNLTLKKVAHVADFLRKNKDARICVVGHPDVVEGQNEQTNLTLATKRAEAVRTALVKQFGIDEKRISIDCKNETLKAPDAAGDWVPGVTFVME